MTDYPLDPDAAARVASFGVIPPMRQRGLDAVRQGLESAPLPDDLPPMTSVENRSIPGVVGDVEVRIYRPTPAKDGPVLVYFHGGTVDAHLDVADHTWY